VFDNLECKDKLNEVISGNYDVNRFFSDLNKANINNDYILKELVENMLPVNIVIETIRECNLRCPLCRLQVDERVQKRGIMSNDIFDKIVNDLVNLGTIKEYALYHRGEPFLDPYIIDRIKKIKQMTNSKVLIDSNLSLDIDPFEVVKSGLDVLNVAVDGFTQKTYSQYRIGGNLDKVISNICRISVAKQVLKSKTPILVGKIILFKHVIEEVDLVKVLVLQAGVNEALVQFAVVPEVCNDDPKKWIPEKQEYSRYNTKQLYDNNILIPQLSYVPGLSSCRGILGTIHPVIDYQGNVYHVVLFTTVNLRWEI
jgi:MoaA/NifB/PqqE/SkfB family radical SAM enzyme